ncbi:MAG: DUF4493 domain-containing protein [Bacteroidaceae bacterium]|nr:DUF4493 domain-containing protein [Bacteroidaceae bacterium]
MKHNSRYVVLAMAALLFGVVSCQQEELRQQETKSMGRIVLSSSDIAVFTSDVVTRATLDNYSGYVFTLNGTTVDGWTVQDSVITFTNNAAIIEAGTYRLSANNDAASAPTTGNGCANYRGQSGEFSLSIGGTTTVTIGSDLTPLTPQNTVLTVDSTSTFSTYYTDVCLTLSGGGRTIAIGKAGDYDEAYFPAGTALTYTLTAHARRDKHLTDISTTSRALPVTLVAGKHYTLSLTLDPESLTPGEIVPIISGTHTGEFD